MNDPFIILLKLLPWRVEVTFGTGRLDLFFFLRVFSFLVGFFWYTRQWPVGVPEHLSPSVHSLIALSQVFPVFACHSHLQHPNSPHFLHRSFPGSSPCRFFSAFPCSGCIDRESRHRDGVAFSGWRSSEPKSYCFQ